MHIQNLVMYIKYRLLYIQNLVIGIQYLVSYIQFFNILDNCVMFVRKSDEYSNSRDCFALIALLLIIYKRAIASVSRISFPLKAFSETWSVALRMGEIIEMTKHIIYFVFQLIKGKE